MFQLPASPGGAAHVSSDAVVNVLCAAPPGFFRGRRRTAAKPDRIFQPEALEITAKGVFLHP